MGYLVCENCEGYYELQEGESLENFEECECGGNLKYVENLNSNPQPENTTKEGEKKKKGIIKHKTTSIILYIAISSVLLILLLANINLFFTIPPLFISLIFAITLFILKVLYDLFHW